MHNIVDVVVADKNLATMSKGVKAAGLETELSKQGPFTLFAPTELAFGKYAQAELNELFKPENKTKLEGMLKYHVVDGRTNFKELKDGQKLKTIGGKQLDVKIKDGNVTINGAKLEAQDHQASNGVVFAIDKVIS
jgi:uncharacterized surface protein with fasciclin (FAS1) repeats